MRIATRHRPTDGSQFAEQVRAALLVLAARPGFLRGELGRSADDPSLWLFTTQWANAGSMRRGLGSPEAKIALAPVMTSAADEPGVFEVLLRIEEGEIHDGDSDRAADPAPDHAPTRSQARPRAT